ncbi:MAG: hypothetical protein Q6373_002900 [Candidatus Sigynarchaeota archaeon]
MTTLVKVPSCCFWIKIPIVACITEVLVVDACFYFMIIHLAQLFP